MIYDGDVPNLPLWMSFDVTNTTWLKHSGSPAGPNAVVAMNGYMVTCGQGNAGRLSVVNFIADDGYVTESGASLLPRNAARTLPTFPSKLAASAGHQLTPHS